MVHITFKEHVEIPKTFNISISNGSMEEFNGRCTKNDFSGQTFWFAIIADADIKCLESTHTPWIARIIWYVFGAHAGEIEDSRMVRTVYNFENFDKIWLTIFRLVLTPFWQAFIWLKHMFDANYQSSDYPGVTITL